MSVGDLWKVRFITRLAQQTAFNVLHWTVIAETAPEPTPTDWAGFWDTLMRPLYLPIMTNQAEFRGVGAQRVVPIPPLIEAFSTGGASPGTSISDPLPKQCCGMISRRAAVAGHRFRARTYMPFPSEALNDVSSDPTAAYLGLLVPIRDAWIQTQIIPGNAGGSHTVRPVVFHRSTNSGTLLQTGIIQDRWATQRRRGDYGRPNAPPV